ncbi:SRPBCC family protein [Methylocaldum marinum]|nr:SRPBCC family protein [Methylocaldum marinum]
MLRIVAVVVILLLAAVLVYAATRPDTFRVQRTTDIKAPPEKIFPLINDLHSMNSWSPYEKKDPEMKRTYSGAPDGKGVVYEWDGNQEIGQGRMEITESSPPSRIAMKLDFIRPFEAHNMVEFTLQSRGDTTQATWAMYGPLPYISKLIGIFISMDKMIGKDFEAGLARLKAIAEDPGH